MNSLKKPIVFFDSEYTSWEGSVERSWSRPNEHRELIQLSGIKVNNLISLHGLVFFNLFSYPSLNPSLSQYFQDLTGISQSYIDKYGVTTGDVIEQFLAFAQGTNMISWGNDLLILKENALLKDIKATINVDENIDFRALLDSIGLDPSGVDSGNASKLFNTSNQIFQSQKKHNALSDCMSMLMLAQGIAKSNLRSNFYAKLNKY